MAVGVVGEMSEKISCFHNIQNTPACTNVSSAELLWLVHHGLGCIINQMYVLMSTALDRPLLRRKPVFVSSGLRLA